MLIQGSNNHEYNLKDTWEAKAEAVATGVRLGCS